MHLFGNKCFINVEHVDTKVLLEHSNLVWDDRNPDIIVSRLENIVGKLGYTITYKRELHKLSYKNIRLDRYKEISFETFINKNTYLLFLTDGKLQEKYTKIFSKITWQKVEEENRYKFNISDISKNPYS